MRGMAGAVARAGGSAGRAAADFVFTKSGALDGRLTFSRGTSLGATVTDATGTLRTAPHNLVPNSANLGTGTSLPTGWNLPAVTGITFVIVGKGVEDGIPYVDYSMQGTNQTGTTQFPALQFDPGIPAAVGAQYTMSVYARVLSGSTTSHSIQIGQFNASAVWLGAASQSTVTLPTTGTLSQSRMVATGIGVATLATISSQFFTNVGIGQSVNAVIRIGGAMLEMNATPSAFLPTTGTAAYGPRIDYATQRNLSMTTGTGAFFGQSTNTFSIGSTLTYSSAVAAPIAGAGVTQVVTSGSDSNVFTFNVGATVSTFVVSAPTVHSCYVYIPSAFVGTIAVNTEGGGNFTRAPVVALDMNKRDQWQRVSVVSTPSATGPWTWPACVFRTSAGGQTFYTSCWQSEWGSTPSVFQSVTSGLVATTECLGLLMEPASTNYVVNPRGEGATVGTLGSGGVMPTDWSAGAPAGIAVSVSLVTNSGKPCVRVRFNGTPSVGGVCSLRYCGVTAPPAVSGLTAGQQVTQSLWLAITGGSTTNITSINHWAPIQDSTSTTQQDFQNTIAATSALTRYKMTQTVPATGTGPYKFPGAQVLAYVTATGVATDITLDVSVPQVEVLADVTSPILPPVGAPAATARAADSLTCDPTPYFGRVSRTNLVTNSGDLSTNWTYGNCTRTGGFTAPDGTANAIKLTEDTTNTQKAVSQFVSVANNAIGSTFTVSVFAKAAERTNVAVTMFGEAYATFDLSGGTVTANPGGTATITSVGSGWYRCAWTVTRSNANGTAYFIPLNNGNIYLGDGTSGLYLWGAQVVAGTTPAAYIPTTGSTVTVSEVGPGMVVMDYDTPSIVNLNYHLWSLDDGIGSIANVFGSFINGNALSTTVWMHAGNSNFNQTYDGSQTTIVGATNKYAIAWDGSLVRRSMNAGTVRNTVSSSVYGISRMLIGGQLVGYVIPLNGHVRRFRVFNGAQTAAAVQKATA